MPWLPSCSTLISCAVYHDIPPWALGQSPSRLTWTCTGSSTTLGLPYLLHVVASRQGHHFTEHSLTLSSLQA